MSACEHIVIVDDHNLIATGCEAEFARAGLEWRVSWYAHCRDVVLPEVGPVVVLLDLRLNDDSEPTRFIAEMEARHVPVIVYTSGEDPYLLRRSIAAGALAVVNKGAPPEDLISAVRAALDGRAVGSPDWASALDTDDELTVHFNAVEIEVLRLYAGGLKASAVARKLGKSVNTVNTYVARIREKYRIAGRLQNDNRVGLFQEAAKDGFVPYCE